MSLPPVIGICGYKRSGKNEVARILTERYGYVQRNFADPLKAMALAIDPVIEYDGLNETLHIRLADLVECDGWETAKEIPDVRRFLQRLGTEGVRQHLGIDAWVAAWRNGVAREWARDETRRIVASDVRFLNEAQAIRAAGGQVWRIGRPGTTSDGHASETEFDDIVPDRIIWNDDTLDILAGRVSEQLEAR